MLGGAAAIVGITVFGVMAWRAVTVDEVTVTNAGHRLSAIRGTREIARSN